MRKSLNLDEARGEAGAVTLGGQLHTVTPLDGAAYRELRAIGARAASRSTTIDDVETLYQVAARCLPSLEREAVDHLTMLQINAILAIAGGQADLVATVVSREAEAKAPGADVDDTADATASARTAAEPVNEREPAPVA